MNKNQELYKLFYPDMDIAVWGHVPDYADDPRLVLEEMRGRGDWDKFMGYLHAEVSGYTGLLVDLILDKTGKMADLAIEFLRREK